MLTTTFYLIRHCERIDDPQRLVGRTPGVHLSERGRAQAERIARRLAGETLHRVFCSPLERTRQTAAPLARAKQLPLEVCAEIGEIDAGAWTGRTFPQLDADDEHWRRYNHFRSGTPIPGGESVPLIQARFVGEMLSLRERLPGEGIALVSHADPIKIALAYFLGMPADFYDRIEIGLGSISVLALHAWGAKALRLNEVPAE
jgi:probable phosphoglycerate mutase